FGVGVTEGASSTDWAAWVIRHHNGVLVFKHGTPGTSVTSVIGPTLSLPVHLGTTFDDSENAVTGLYSTDGSEWFEIGSTTRDLSNYRAKVFGTSHEFTATTTATLTAAFSTSITITDAGDPDPPTGDEFKVSTGITLVDCGPPGIG